MVMMKMNCFCVMVGQWKTLLAVIIVRRFLKPSTLYKLDLQNLRSDVSQMKVYSSEKHHNNAKFCYKPR